MIYKLKIIFVFLAVLFTAEYVLAQETGEPLKGFNPDTTFVFESPRPLIDNVPPSLRNLNKFGVDMIISGSGYGLGFRYSRQLSDFLAVFTSFYISGARNTDEFEYYNPITGEVFIPGKINRLFLIPLIFGTEFHLFAKSLDDSFRPYLKVGIGPSFVLRNNYQTEFFKALGQMDTYTRFGAMGGLGANLLGHGKTSLGIDISYFYIPFGGEGLESIEGMPITNFGGIVLSLNYTFKF